MSDADPSSVQQQEQPAPARIDPVALQEAIDREFELAMSLWPEYYGLTSNQDGSAPSARRKNEGNA